MLRPAGPPLPMARVPTRAETSAKEVTMRALFSFLGMLLWAPALALAQAAQPTSPAPRTPPADPTTGGGGGGWMWWILVAIIVLAIVWWAAGSGRRRRPVT